MASVRDMPRVSGQGTLVRIHENRSFSTEANVTYIDTPSNEHGGHLLYRCIFHPRDLGSKIAKGKPRKALDDSACRISLWTLLGGTETPMTYQ